MLDLLGFDIYSSLKVGVCVRCQIQLKDGFRNLWFLRDYSLNGSQLGKEIERKSCIMTHGDPLFQALVARVNDVVGRGLESYSNPPTVMQAQKILSLTVCSVFESSDPFQPIDGRASRSAHYQDSSSSSSSSSGSSSSYLLL